MKERYELPQRGPEQSTGRKSILGIFLGHETFLVAHICATPYGILMYRHAEFVLKKI